MTPAAGAPINFADPSTYNNATSQTVYDAKGQSVALTVTDNGRGLSGHGQSGLGVVGMHERALLLGGELQVETVGDRGTVVRAVVPFESREITA